MTTKLPATVTDIATQTQAEVGTDTTTLMTPERTKQAIDALAIFNNGFDSGELVINTGGSYTFAHGLGTVPKLIQCVLVCKIVELGYSIGDEVFINPHGCGFADDQGVSVSSDTTHIYIKYSNANSNAFTIIQKNFGNDVDITNNYWRLIVRAWG